MSLRQQTGICPEHGQVLLAKEGPAHLVHFLLVILTFGLWLPVWAGVTVVRGMTAWRCQICGREIEPEERYITKDTLGI